MGIVVSENTDMAVGIVGGIVVLVHTSAAPTNEGWRLYIDALAKSYVRAQLVVTFGGNPNAGQRKLAVQTIWDHHGEVFPTAVLADSAPVRGIVTAINWIVGRSDQVKAFSPGRFREACAFAGAAQPESQQMITQLITEACHELKLPPFLADG